MASRRAEVGLYANPSKLRAGLRQATGMIAGFSRKAGDAMAKGLGKAGGFVARSLDPLGRAYDVIARNVDDAMEFEKGIARMGIAQGRTNDEMAGFRAELGQISEETGVARNDILRGAQAYQALTGDTEGASAAARTFARVAQATGSTVDDVAATAAALQQNLKIAPGDLEA